MIIGSCTITFMKKSRELIKRAYIKSIAYRSEVLLWLFLDSVPLLVLILIWLNIYQNQTQVAGYSLSQMLQYYFLVTIIAGLASTHFESWRVKEIREGKIDFFLTRPLGYLRELFLHDVGGKFLYLTLALPAFLLIYWLLTSFLPIDFPQLKWLSLLIFGFLIITTYLIEFFMATLVVLAGFWFERAEGLEHFKWIIVALLSGWMIPIAAMPDWLGQLVMKLPFKYMYAVPIGIIQGNWQLTATDFLYIGGFIFSLLILVRLVWNKAQYKYASHGG